MHPMCMCCGEQRLTRIGDATNSRNNDWIPSRLICILKLLLKIKQMTRTTLLFLTRAFSCRLGDRTALFENMAIFQHLLPIKEIMPYVAGYKAKNMESFFVGNDVLLHLQEQLSAQVRVPWIEGSALQGLTTKETSTEPCLMWGKNEFVANYFGHIKFWLM